MLLAALPFLRALPLTTRQLDAWPLLQLLGPALEQALQAQQSFSLGLDLRTTGLLPQQAEPLRRLQRFLSQAGGQLELGFPLLLHPGKTTGHGLQAPLFFWTFDCKPSAEKGCWELHFDHKTLQPNRLLLQHLDLPSPSWPSLDPWLQALGLASLPPRTWQALPTEWQAPRGPRLCWAALLGHYQQTAALEQLQKPRLWPLALTPSPLSLGQAPAAAAFFAGQSLSLQGPSQSGKTHLAANLLPSILAERGTVLVLSHKTASFSDWGFHLQQMGLRSVGLLFLEEAQQDQLRWTEQWKKIQKLPQEKLDERSFTADSYRFQQVHQQLQSHYQALCPHAEDSWAARVAAFLQQHRQSGRHLLMQLLKPADFRFEQEEFQQLYQELGAQIQLFGPIQGLDHPLAELPDFIFTEHTYSYACAWLIDPLRQRLQLLRQLSHDYTAFLDDFNNELWWEYQSYAQQVEQQLIQLRSLIQLYRSLYGPDFETFSLWSSAKSLFLGIFSRYHAQMQQARNQLQADYEALLKVVQQTAYFTVQAPKFGQLDSLQTFEQALGQVEQAWQDWQRRIPKIVQQRVDELHSQYPVKPPYRQRMEQLERQWQSWLMDWNQQGFWKNPLPIKGHRISERISQLRRLLSQLSKAETALADFETFYNWRHHWLCALPATRLVVQALLEIQASPDQWLNIFQSWYRSQWLGVQYRPALPTASLPLAEYEARSTALRQHLGARAYQAYWLSCQTAKPSNQGESLERLLIQWPWEQFARLFPITFAHPQRARLALAPLKPQFDLVVLEDAHLFSAEELEQFRHWGKQVVVLSQTELAHLPTAWLRYRLPALQNKNMDLPPVLLHATEQMASPSALAQLLQADIQQKYPQLQVQLGVVYAGLAVDLLLQGPRLSKPLAILLDAGLGQHTQPDFVLLHRWRQALEKANWAVREEWSVHWWRNPEAAAHALLQWIGQQH